MDVETIKRHLDEGRIDYDEVMWLLQQVEVLTYEVAHLRQFEQRMCLCKDGRVCFGHRFLTKYLPAQW